MIAVTGAAGFIGSAIIWALNQQGASDILAVDSLGRDEKWKNLSSLKIQDYWGKDEFLQAVESRSPLLNSLEGIIHMGACSSTTETDASYMLRNNFTYTKKIALWAMEKGLRFVYASSAATYGDGRMGFSDNLIEELRPLNIYAYSKQLFDIWAKKKGLLNKIAGLKYFNVFGPNEYHKGSMRSVVLKAFEQIQETEKVKLFKSYHPDYPHGGQKRDFVYVKDAAKATVFIYYNREACGIINIGTGKARTFLELVQAVFRALNKKEKIEFIDMPEGLAEKYQYFTQADIQKLLNLGYPHSFTPLEEAIEDYIKNYLLASYPYLSS